MQKRRKSSVDRGIEREEEGIKSIGVKDPERIIAIKATVK